MLTKFSFDNESEMREWDEFVASHPKGSPYHMSCWLRTIQETYSFELLLYVEKNGSGNITGVLPCFFIRNLLTGPRLVSLPFSDYCGPIFMDYYKERGLLKELIMEYGKQSKYIEIRSSVPERCGLICNNYYKGHILNLEKDLSVIRKGIDKRTIQYSIRKAEKAGIEIKEENNQYGMDEFYRLNVLTRKKHGVPSQPKKLFENLFYNMVLKGHAFILLAIYDSKVIGASVFFQCNKSIHYKYNASDPDYLKKTSPNHSLTWYAIKKGVTEGYRFLDFGRTSPDNLGLMRYKEMWGTEIIDLPYYYYPQVKGASSTEEKSLFYRILTSFWRSLPDAIVEKIGPMIYKHMA